MCVLFFRVLFLIFTHLPFIGSNTFPSGQLGLMSNDETLDRDSKGVNGNSGITGDALGVLCFSAGGCGAGGCGAGGVILLLFGFFATFVAA